ncbi:hypothetical protein MtrunA17_Chr3g0128161 [Medicago truncatula]|uniref:Uncharacterized protein n=1 Tax=Medicago truncatula TaxID=3880 RepID=A0A396IVK9_MEDTR|nr:hypothetical protein MtrunA17_Chr3g0128161 [Medicago truncatula]
MSLGHDIIFNSGSLRRNSDDIIINSGSLRKNYSGKLTFRVFITCFTATFGGLIFGYDIGISGIHSISFYILFSLMKSNSRVYI